MRWRLHSSKVQNLLFSLQSGCKEKPCQSVETRKNKIIINIFEAISTRNEYFIMTRTSFQHRLPSGFFLSRLWSHDDDLFFTERSHSSTAIVACVKIAFGKYMGDFQSHEIWFRHLLPLNKSKLGHFPSVLSLKASIISIWFSSCGCKKKKIQGDVTGSLLWLSPQATECEALFYHWCHGKNGIWFRAGQNRRSFVDSICRRGGTQSSKETDFADTNSYLWSGCKVYIHLESLWNK